MNKNPDILFRNFDVFQNSGEEAKSLKSLVFQLAISGRLDFQKLSGGRIKQPLQTLVKRQKAYLQKEGIPFSMPGAGQSLTNLQKGHAAAESPPVTGKAKKQAQKKSAAFAERADSIWPMAELREFCELLRGVTYSKKDEIAKGGNVVLRANNIDIDGSLNLKEIKQISKKTNETQRLIKNDIFICLASGSIKHIGKTAFIEQNTDYYFGGFMGCIRTNKDVLSKYLFHLLHAPRFNKYLASTISSTNINNLSKKVLYNYNVPLPPLEVQKEIVTLMEKCALLESQAKEKSQKQEGFSKSAAYFITQSKSKKELSHYWKMLKRNFKDVLCSESGAKEFKAMAFQLCLNGKLDFQKLSGGRVKQPLQTLVKRQKAYLQKEGIPFSMPGAGQSLKTLQESHAAAKSPPVTGKAKKQIEKDGAAFDEQPDSIWPMVELGDICEFNPKKSKVKDLPKNQLVSFVPMADLSAHNMSIRVQNEKKIKDVYSGYTYFAEEDVLLARVTPCFENGKSGIARNLKNGIGFGSSEFFVYRINKKNILSEIIYYLISSNIFIDIGKKNMGGTGGLQRLTKDYAIKYKIPLPPLEVQKEIAAFMEHIEKTERQIQEEKSLSVQLAQSLSHLDVC